MVTPRRSSPVQQAYNATGTNGLLPTQGADPLAFEQCFTDRYVEGTHTETTDPTAQLFGACAIAVRATALTNWSRRPEIDLIEHLDAAWRLSDGSVRRLPTYLAARVRTRPGLDRG